MRSATFLAATLFISLTAHVSTSKADTFSGSRQMVTIVAESWDSTMGELRRYERGDDDRWREIGQPVPVVLGKKGLGWGVGLHETPKNGPVKVEGDRRSPAGAFLLSTAFGYEPEPKLKFPYLRSESSVECVDDTQSNFYNRIVDRTAVAKPDWRSSELMRRKDHLYKVGIVVGHNAVDYKPGAGSCVFLHIWRSPKSATMGCSAMDESALREILHWLEGAARPVLVQLPREEYEAVRARWKLP